MTFDVDVFWRYLWPFTALENNLIRDGLIATVIVAVVAQVLALALGLAVALCSTTRSRALRTISRTYVTYFRGTPLLVQLFLIYFGSASLGLYDFSGRSVAGIAVPGVIQAGVVGLTLNKAAYLAEILRAGISGVDPGQKEAALAMGLTPWQTMRKVVLPQAFKLSVPAIGNEFNGTIKDTTLLVTIGGVELFNAYSQLNSVMFKPTELFLAMSFYYLAMTVAWSLVQGVIERRLAKGPSGRNARRQSSARTSEPALSGKGAPSA